VDNGSREHVLVWPGAHELHLLIALPMGSSTLQVNG
jgi:hypothetical protein